MRRTSLALSILGLSLAAMLPASAQKTIKLFGTTYVVTAQDRNQTYKNGVQIHTDRDVNRFAGISFSEGANPASDRLWFGCRIGNGEDITGDQVYCLDGTDDKGNFTAAASNAKSFFGGDKPNTFGRRPISILEINRFDTGKGKDRNIIATTFFDNDCTRMWDLDTMEGQGDTDAIFTRVLPKGAEGNDAGDTLPDPRGPIGGYMAYAPLPKPDGYTVLVVGADPVSEGATQIGIWDTRMNDMFDALTDITAVVKDSTKPLPTANANGDAYWSTAVARYGDQGEYLILYVATEPGGDNDSPRDSHMLARVKLEIPADYATAGPGKIKATVLDTQELTAFGEGVLSQEGKCGPVSIAVGRELVAGGPRLLYITDYAGFLYTLTPQ
jgi:hypothetical protein